MKKNRIIAVLGILCVLSLSIMTLALCRSESDSAFVPPPFEQEAQLGIPSVPEGLGYQELDVQVFRVCLCGVVRLHDGAAQVWFANPQDNPVWLKLRILDENGQILGQSGILRPGEYVRQVAVADVKPGTPVILKVMAYEPDTYYSAGALVFHTRIASE